ncbi:MAG: hypothetical protein LBE35_09420 [Clostridiales bacterium]|jgi:hypothetical protein|nr:hypothetical protein [Clostridiales bacterium]
MPWLHEMRALQKRNYREFLVVKKELASRGIVSKSLEEYLNAAKTEMDAEDAAYVEKVLNELPQDN